MRALFLSLVLFVVVPGLATAKTFKLGDDKAVAKITIPDSWKPDEIENGVEGTSKDGETYVAAEVVKAKDVEDALTEGFKFFKKEGVTIDESTLEKKEIKMNGLPAFDIAAKGKDKDGPTHVGLTLVILNRADILLLTYWGTATGEESNGADLKAIAGSIAPIAD